MAGRKEIAFLLNCPSRLTLVKCLLMALHNQVRANATKMAEWTTEWQSLKETVQQLALDCQEFEVSLAAAADQNCHIRKVPLKLINSASCSPIVLAKETQVEQIMCLYR